MKRIFLCDTNQDIAGAWQYTIEFYPELKELVRIGSYDITKLEVDAVVAPGNSFGFMTGGIDLVYKQFFGDEVQKQIQSELQQFALHPLGELLVGEALLIFTNHPDIKQLIYAPTMRTPRRISYSSDVYLSTKAAYLMAKKYDIQSIAFPGMGTGTGGVTPSSAAKLMIQAIHDVEFPIPFPKTLKQINM